MHLNRRQFPNLKPGTEGSKMERRDGEEAVAFQVVDKRSFCNPDSVAADGQSVPKKPRYPTYVEELLAKVAAAERNLEEKKKLIDEEIVRTRTRLEADSQRRVELEKQKMLLPFLDILDNLERAINAATTGGKVDSLLEGVQMTASLLRSRFQALGVEPIPVIGQEFDPNVGQAVGIIEVTEPGSDGMVMDEVLRGYRMGDQLLRPARVRVGQYNS
jgi:molecular chaperone GrpE